MINWTAIKPLIVQQVSGLTKLPATSVRWVDEPSGPLAGIAPIIWMRVSAIVGIGTDYEVREDNGTDDQTVKVVGQRQFTLSIRCESFTQDLTDSRHAANIVDALKIRLFRESSIQERAGIYAIQNLIGGHYFNFIDKGGRVVNTSIADFRCLTSNVDIDDTIDAGDFIDETQGDSVDAVGNPGLTYGPGDQLEQQVSFDVDSTKPFTDI